MDLQIAKMDLDKFKRASLTYIYKEEEVSRSCEVSVVNLTWYLNDITPEEFHENINVVTDFARCIPSSIRVGFDLDGCFALTTRLLRFGGTFLKLLGVVCKDEG